MGTEILRFTQDDNFKLSQDDNYKPVLEDKQLDVSSLVARRASFAIYRRQLIYTVNV